MSCSSASRGDATFKTENGLEKITHANTLDKATFEASNDKSRFIKEKLSNVKSDLIEITDDKLENILVKHCERLDLRTKWIAPASVCISLVFASNTSNFIDKWGFSAATWEALALLIISLTLLCSLFLIWQAVTNRGKSSPEYLLQKIKNSDGESD